MLSESRFHFAGKKIIPFICLLFLFINSCKDSEPTAPNDNQPAPLAEKTIGPEGGILETESFKLTVPNSAFTTAAQLKLYAEPDTVPFGEFGVSKLFRVKGMPTNYQQPLQISLKYAGNLSGVNFIILGIKDTIELIDTSFIDIRYSLLDAQESGGFLTAEIPINKLGKNTLDKINATEAEVLLGALTGGTNEPVGAHFKIKGIFPADQRANVNKIIEYFEEAYTRFQNAGFDYSNVTWPMEIEIVNKPNANLGTYTFCLSLWPVIHYGNQIILSNKLRKEIVFAFIYKVLLTYHESYVPVDAVAYWASFQFGIDKSDLEFYMKDLMSNGRFNYGISEQTLIIDYIAEKNGENKIAQLCKKNKSFPLAVTDLLGNPKANTWLNRFYEYTMTSNKYENIYDNFFIDKSHVKAKIDQNFNTKTFTNAYNVLSAKWHHLELASGLNENTKLKFNTNSTTSGITIIKTRAGERREVVQSGYGAVTVSGVKPLADAGYNLFALVINSEYEPPNGQNTITLKVEKTDEAAIVGCSVFLRYLTGDFIKQVPNNPPETINGADLGVGFPKDADTASVVYNSSTRTLTQQYVNHKGNDNQYYTGRIEITFGDDNKTYISSFSADWERTGSFGTYRNSLSATNIPQDNSVSYLRFRLAGQSVCEAGKIVSLSKYEDHGTYTYTFIAGTQQCSSNSELVVYISMQ